jgi:hypothetical protein
MLPLLVLVGTTTVAAQWHLDVGVGSHYPLEVAARATVEGPYRLLATASAGLMPSPYLASVDAILVGASVYSESTATLIEAALDNALVVRVMLGWRPFEDAGLYFLGGYSIAALGGGVTGAELIAGVTGRALPEGAGSNIQIAASSIVQQVNLEIGWRFQLWEQLYLQASIGGFLTVAASTTLTPEVNNPRSAAALESLASAGEVYLDDTLTDYVHSPLIGLQVGWTFF